MRPLELVVHSDLPAPLDVVWERVASLAGVNHELGPWLRMTSPRGAVLTSEAVPLGRRWFRSWLLVGGVLPVDFDDLTVVRLDPPHGFLERSRMLSARLWEHERMLAALPAGGTRVTDRIRCEPRSPLTAPVLRALVPRTFAHRHRRLRAHFGASG